MKTIFVMILLLLVSCAATQEPTIPCPPCASELSAERLFELSREQARRAEASRELRQKATLAGEGLGYAQFCLNKDPENVGCYYYRAVNRGLWLETGSHRASEQVQKMISDYKVVLIRDSTYDDGGAARALSLLCPKFGVCD